jgi:transposase
VIHIVGVARAGASRCKSAIHAGMTLSLDELPNDVASLKALLLAAHADNAQLAARNERLDHIIKVLRRARFGRSSERIDDDQLNLALEDVEAGFAADDAKAEQASDNKRRDGVARRRANRGHLPAHLPREEIVIEPEARACPCCGGALHVIGEDVAERLDKVPAKLRVIVTRRPKYACRRCTDGVVQAPAPNRLIEGGLPTEMLVADVLVSKYADHRVPRTY